MKDLSLFLLKNTMTARMKKGFKSFCNGDGSTSTLNQQKMKLSEEVDNITVPALSADRESSLLMENAERTKNEATTLEEMIMQLELEEKMARRREEESSAGERSRMLQQQRRMSCVNSSDILRSARNALNQYPRFSLDGKDAMYRSSFRNFGCPVENNMDVNISSGARRSTSTTTRFKSTCNCSCRICRHNHQYSYRVLKKNDERQLCSCNHVESRGIGSSGGGRGGGQQLRPVKVTGDESCSVVWCKPGLVAKLMGLEAMPIPVLQLMNNDANNNKMMTGRRLSNSSAVDNNFKKQNQLLKNRGREGGARVDSHKHNENLVAYNKRPGTSDKKYYLHPSRPSIIDNNIMIRKHIPMEEVAEFDEPGWPLRPRFL
ncbi:uncharacterized protein LOC141667485 [Apium graveolens]|uniref:uncharacterized protein LOC141667485 n=1 Tax=Apium graveolens TaxID=4045 RepID=UPI003D79AB7C